MEVSLRRTVSGVLWGLSAALAYSVSPVFVRVGMMEGHSPHIALTVGVTAAFVAYVTLLALFDRRSLDPTPFRSRESLGWEVAASASIVTGSWLRYVAMTLAPLAIVSALGRVSILVILLLARREVTWKVWVGGSLIVAGAICIHAPL